MRRRGPIRLLVELGVTLIAIEIILMSGAALITSSGQAQFVVSLLIAVLIVFYFHDRTTS